MKKKIFELNRQLHEQYAINNNSNLGSIIALMTAMLGVLGVNGYIFIYLGSNLAPDWLSFYNGQISCSDSYSISLFIEVTFVSFILFYCIKLKFFSSYKHREKEYSKNKYGSEFKSNYMTYFSQKTQGSRKIKTT